ncbi:MAG TPA: hypothetical protein VKY85_20650 [Candidatus Angelobacter sp.]|nr:hypothetical protein [Candidatus Angelobacter sp.]
MKGSAIGIVVLLAALSAAALPGDRHKNNDKDKDRVGHVRWTRNGAPTETTITNGPWTLEQSGAANGLKSSGYCDAQGNQIGNPGTERMQPYYFPSIVGHGKHLQGYFDWRPKDTDEGVAAASSDDAGQSWTFQQLVLELRKHCPDQANKEPDGEKDAQGGNNADNGDDDGQGHQFVIKIAGHTYLYTLIRAAGHIDVDDLVIHDLTPQPGKPLNGAPALDDAPTDQTTGDPEPAFHTHGLLNPDGILGIVPGSNPLTIIYEQKILSGDNTGNTAFPAAQQCNTFWANFYAANGGLSPNDDITFLRLASTTDGVNFKDLGPLQGLNDPTSVSLTGTRWLATAGTILKLEDGRFGLLFSGGNCIDADSDAFHYIGYAESTDLIHWTVVNGINNPIISVFPATLSVNAQGVPATGTGTSPVTIPANTPVVGNTLGFFAGRVYAPSATRFEDNDITVIFAGYHTQKPKNGLGDYRTIGRVSLHSNQHLVAVGQGDTGDSDRDDDDSNDRDDK